MTLIIWTAIAFLHKVYVRTSIIPYSQVHTHGMISGRETRGYTEWSFLEIYDVEIVKTCISYFSQ